MSTTPNLSLNVYEAIDNPLVKSWRDGLSLNGAGASLVKIDTWAGQTNIRLNNLEGARTNFRVLATSVVRDNYTVTSSEIISLISGIQVQFSASQSNVGTSTLNINDIGTKTISKINNLGATVALELNDIIPNRMYTLEYDGIIWILKSGFTGSQIIINGTVGNILSIDAQNNPVDSNIALVAGKITSAGITMGAGITGDGNGSIMLSNTDVAAGTYVGLTIDTKGRIIQATTPNPSITGNETLIATNGVLSWATQAPDSSKFGGQLPAYYLSATATAVDSDKVDGTHASATPTASTIPIADVGGKLAAGWMPEFTPSTVTNPTWTTSGTAFTNQPIGVSCKLTTIGSIKILTMIGQCHATSGGTGIFTATFGTGNIPSSTTQLICSSHNQSTVVSGFASISGLVVTCSKDGGVTLATDNEYFRVDVVYI